MNDVTVKTVCEMAAHEGIVLEWYRDGGGVGTWAIGVTNASGHNIDRYKDHPQTIERCLEVSIWLMRTKYGADVNKAFAGHPLTEAQFAALLCWHYNTGRIGNTDLVGLIKSGQMTAARKFWQSHYLNNGDLQSRRDAEAALFFDGVWSNDGTALIYSVAKPSYRPYHPMRANIVADVTKALAAQ